MLLTASSIQFSLEAAISKAYFHCFSLLHFTHWIYLRLSILNCALYSECNISVSISKQVAFDLHWNIIIYMDFLISMQKWYSSWLNGTHSWDCDFCLPSVLSFATNGVWVCVCVYFFFTLQRNLFEKFFEHCF